MLAVTLARRPLSQVHRPTWTPLHAIPASWATFDFPQNSFVWEIKKIDSRPYKKSAKMSDFFTTQAHMNLLNSSINMIPRSTYLPRLWRAPEAFEVTSRVAKTDTYPIHPTQPRTSLAPRGSGEAMEEAAHLKRPAGRVPAVCIFV